MSKKIGSIIFLIAIVGLAVFLIWGREKGADIAPEDLHLAMYYEKLGHNMVRCNLCPNKCILAEGQIGDCKARKNIEGELYSMVYGKVVAAHLDPIEKKPLYHFLPGTKAYSIATTGCNLQCKFCQNWQIAQIFPWEAETKDMTPQQVVDNAIESKAESIAYTYTEPTVFYEYMLDIAKLAHKNGLKNVVISAGYINPEPLLQLLPYIDAYKIDFKGFNPEFYQNMTVTGTVEPVLEAMKVIKQEGVWLEIVNLVIPEQNDSQEEIKNLILWVRDNLGQETPLHFTRFHPDYKLLNTPPTPLETLKTARQMALDLGMKYVYTGNVYDPEGSATYCEGSDEPAIERDGYFVEINNLDENGYCSEDQQIPGVWQ